MSSLFSFFLSADSHSFTVRPAGLDIGVGFTGMFTDKFTDWFESIRECSNCPAANRLETVHARICNFSPTKPAAWNPHTQTIVSLVDFFAVIGLALCPRTRRVFSLFSVLCACWVGVACVKDIVVAIGDGS